MSHAAVGKIAMSDMFPGFLVGKKTGYSEAEILTSLACSRSTLNVVESTSGHCVKGCASSL